MAIIGVPFYTLCNAIWVVGKKDVKKEFCPEEFFQSRWETLIRWDRQIDQGYGSADHF
jgi:hypothetical protein